MINWFNIHVHSLPHRPFLGASLPLFFFPLETKGRKWQRRVGFTSHLSKRSHANRYLLISTLSLQW